MRSPESVTRNATWSSIRCAMTVIVPPGGVNFTALLRRFHVTCCSRAASPHDRQGLGRGVDRDAFRLRGRTHNRDGGADNPQHVHRLARQTDLPGRDVTDIQQVGDRLGLRTRVPLDYLEAAREHLGIVRAAQHLCPPEDGVERCAQFMGERRHELIAMTHRALDTAREPHVPTRGARPAPRPGGAVRPHRCRCRTSARCVPRSPRIGSARAMNQRRAVAPPSSTRYSTS